MEEIWKDCKHYEGLYEVSNLGRVRSKDTGKIKAAHDNGRGYLMVSLWKFNKGKNEYVHRLVALTFIDNPENKPTVNHKDENKQNNCVDNLEWMTYSENENYGTKHERQRETVLNNGKTSYKVNQYTLSGEYVATYRSLREAERINGLANGVISQTIKLYSGNSCGYHWELVA